MDNLTHSLVGALIGQAGLKRRTGLAMPALIVGANLPDVDAACFLWLDGVQHLAFRRGITHGPIAWVVLPLMLAGLLYAFDRWQGKRGTRPEGRLPVRFGWLYGLSFLACLTHPALDWLNSYGIRLLEPFSSRWFYGDVLFIIDVWLWALLGFATRLSLRRERRDGEWRRPARVAIAVTLVYIGTNAAISAFAEDKAAALVRHGYGLDPTLVVASPKPFAWWERELLWRWQESDVVRVAAIYGIGGFSIFGKIYLEDQGYDVRSPAITFDRPARPDGWMNTSAFLVSQFRLDDWKRCEPELDAFLFWSRMPIVIEGNEFKPTVVMDQRFLDPRARDRFSVALPDVRCEPIPTPAHAEEAGRP